MTTRHKNLPDDQLHPPKGLISASNKTIYISNGDGTGTWRKVNDTDTDYSDKTKNRFGWNDISDSLYTSGSPRSISSGVRTKLTNNGAKAQTDTSRLGAIWDTTNNQFLVNDLNSFYIVRLNMNIKAAAAAGTPYTVLIESESANGPTVITGSTQYIKGGNYENRVSFTQGIYIGSFINNQALSLYITPDTNITLYDIGFVVQRTYVET